MNDTLNYDKTCLIYHDIVYGAGIGHTMACYNYGLNYSLEQNMIWVPKKLVPGHNLNTCGRIFEEELGLPIYTDEYIEDIKKSCNYKEVLKDTHPGSADFKKTKPIFTQWYKDSRIDKTPMFLNKHKTNICMSIRRGDLAGKPDHPMFIRLKPFDYYINALEDLITVNNISDFRLIVSTDLRGHNNCLVDEMNKPHDVSSIFKKYADDLVFVPFREDEPQENQFHTFDFFHAAVAADYFIGYIPGGMSEVINLIYR